MCMQNIAEEICVYVIGHETMILYKWPSSEWILLLSIMGTFHLSITSVCCILLHGTCTFKAMF